VKIINKVTFGVNKRNILETFILLKKISMKGKFKIFDKRSLMVILFLPFRINPLKLKNLYLNLNRPIIRKTDTNQTKEAVIMLRTLDIPF